MPKKIFKTVRLHSNENPLGPSPIALEAIRKYSQDIHCYADWVPKRLKEKLARKQQVAPENIAVSAGSYELIDLIIHFLVTADEEILTFNNTFMAYSYGAKRNGRKCVVAQMPAPECNLKDLIPLCGNKTKVIFFANPNNPTGTIVTHDSLRDLLETIPSNVLVVADEAYYEYVTDKSYPDSVRLQKEFPNLVILRTFSKIYGLAGVRIGYGIASENLVKKLEEKRLLRSINMLGEKAAEAALDDLEYIRHSVRHNSRERDYLFNELTQLGFAVNKSQANFLYLPFDNDEGKNKVFTTLADDGLIVCDLAIFGHEKSLRISVGKKDVNQRIIDCLRQISI
ncbi:MAG TPA: histidinol-phosphate transaminase [Candidatus Marinimicrobia bacterium]|jgi:histidinol-phosphate aminotransferase|nr:histidinol-phosphate transaminase [Candidatus Neomarinimicrobiota bacterium]MDP6615297.1 histidinol-phosphate transaminase [Candidatus Neomarinimicrobiota bacterium]MEE1506526.1 histidinol-phosphate transaminase [Candidatus Neomarinimicrobiota bacterium]HJL77816.1 histidinol-phosphate transaminase [Candidatus Neomarinimicrobiota bacterium]HJM69314.1 histidinol-phosphate transaminase [Candidatus Neomarinimicrobiota bacterium]|tara:strand:+ start:2933 stop:3952 length:1020 start_codon:yes stop_codon:yes gene_type:complete